MLAQQITKLPSGRFDLSVYQKPMSAYLYILLRVLWQSEPELESGLGLLQVAEAELL